MNTQFSSVEMIKSQFGINEESIDDVRSKLRSIQVEHHPDKNGGSFIDEDSARQYHRLDDAISFIDNLNKSNSDLVTISAVTELTKAVTAMVATRNDVSDKNTILSTEINRSITGYNSKLKMPRIALTTISIAISAIWMFPNTVKEHPVLGNLINFENMTTNIAWLYMLFLAILFWVMTWRSEELTKERKESLKTESVQNKLFNNFVNSVDRDTFILEELVDFIMHRDSRYRRPTSIIFGRSSRTDLPLAHATAEVILERAVKRKALTISNSASISTRYQIPNL